MNMSKDTGVEPAIGLWLFSEAPAQYANLSDNGGDEDWVMFVPDRLADHPLVGRLTDSYGFTVDCDPQEHDVEGGVVYIGQHA